jgi:hypothetical protein
LSAVAMQFKITTTTESQFPRLPEISAVLFVPSTNNHPIDYAAILPLYLAFAQ